jgi:hypothetical protein
MPVVDKLNARDTSAACRFDESLDLRDLLERSAAA